jgi:hypothetical protein
VLSSSSTSHDTVLCPYARLFDHLVGTGDPLWRRRDEGCPFFDDIYRVQLDRLVHRAFIVHGTVRKRYGLPGVQDLFRPSTCSQKSPSTTCPMTTPGWLWRPALKPAAISTVA